MNICFFNSTKSWGGGEKWHYDLALALKNSEHKIHVFTNKKSELFLRLNNKLSNLYSISISNLSFLNPFKLFYLVGLFKKLKIDCIILNLPADVKVAGIAAKIAGVKHIVYRRGSAIPIKNSLSNRLIFKKIITNIIANSVETKRTILANSADLFRADKIEVIYNGIDIEEFDSRIWELIYIRQNSEIILGNAGRLEKQKAQYMLIELAARLKKENINFKLLIAGEGRLKKELIDYSQALNVSDKIIFTGFIKNIKSFMQSIDMFLLPSEWEGFGYVLAEAMLCKLPVVAFNVSSNPEVVSNGITGFLAEKNNLDDFVEKVKILISDKKLSIEFGQNGRRIVENKFDIKTTIKNTVNFLTGL